jgi:hypothetical protein
MTAVATLIAITAIANLALATGIVWLHRHTGGAQ